MRQRVFPGSTERDTDRRIVMETKGFSKVDVDDEDDTDIYMEFLRGKTNPELHVLQAKWAKRREKEHCDGGFDAAAGGKPNDKKDEPEFDIGDDEIFLRYPSPTNARGIITLKELNAMRHTPSLQSHKVRPQALSAKTILGGSSIKRRPLPKYVGMMEKLAEATYDVHTDGTMALEMRRFKQKQRERTPVPVGFLPVRKRYMDELESLYDSMQQQQQRQPGGTMAATAMSIHGRAPTAVRVYLPKSADSTATTTADEEHEEHERLLKLRKADQLELYGNSIERTASFLGKRHAVQLPNQPLSSEELIMLAQLRNVPAFRGSASRPPPLRGAATIAADHVGTGTNRRVEHKRQIRDIMRYVLNKDYSRTDGCSGPKSAPPPRLQRDSEDSD